MKLCGKIVAAGNLSSLTFAAGLKVFHCGQNCSSPEHQSTWPFTMAITANFYKHSLVARGHQWTIAAERAQPRQPIPTVGFT